MATELQEPVTFTAVQGMSKLSILKQLGILVGIAVAVAMGVAIALWGKGTDMRPVFGQLEPAATADVAQQLEQLGYDYKLDQKSGLVLVDANEVYQIRMQLAQQGIPQAQASGYALLDQEQPLGTSSRMESVRYIRSVEGELSQTIASMHSISQARVHLAVPRQTSFIGALNKPSASVMITTTGGALAKDKLQAIKHLVAFSVPDLSPDAVSITDQYANAQGSDEQESIDEQLRYQEQIQQSLQQGIASIMLPVVGANNFSSQVRAEVDFTKVQTAEETFTPDREKIRSEQLNIKVTDEGELPAGIPGALSNQPPGNVEVNENPAVQPVAEEGEENAPIKESESLRNFELDRKLQHTQTMTGVVKRLSASVIVNEAAATTAAVDPSADPANSPAPGFDTERLASLEAALKAAIGFDEARGDTFSLVVQPFFEPPPPVIAPTPFYEQAWFIDVAKLGASALLILAVIFAIFRPMVHRLTEVGAGDHIPDSLAHLSDEDFALPSADDSAIEAELLLGDSSTNNELNAIKNVIAQDSGRAAQVVRRWVNSNG